MTGLETSYYILVFVLGVAAVLMLFLPTRKDPKLAGYNLSLKLLAVSFMALSAYCTFKWAIPQEMFNQFFLFMSSMQAILLGLSHVNLLNPQLVTRRMVKRHFACLLAVTAVYLLVRCFSSHLPVSRYAMLADKDVLLHPEVTVRLVWMWLYVRAVTYYARLFFSEYRAFRSQADNYFSDSVSRPMRKVKASFLLALSVAATTVLITCSLNPTLNMVLNGCILVLYSSLALFFVQYPAVYYDAVSPVITEKDSAEDDGAEAVLWAKHKQRIAEEEMYAQAGITMVKMAQELGTSRTQLSTMINRYEGVNFNVFINRLRISKACRLMEQTPAMKLTEIAELTGYTDQSNFSRSFKQIMGEMPRAYQKKREI